jgi:predicted nucleic acid-binding protein
VVDANVLIAAFMRDSATRRLILLGTHELHAPRYLMEEVEAHWEELSERVGLPEGPLRETLRTL